MNDSSHKKTSEMTRIVRSSPSPEELDVQVSMVDGKFDVNVNGMDDAESYNIDVISDRAGETQLSGSKRSFSVAENHATLEDMELSRKDSLTFYVAAKMGRSSAGEIRETDAIAIETPFRLCNWVEEESRLSCTGKDDLRSQILTWSVIGDRVQVNVKDVGQTDIACDLVKVLNVDNNLLNGVELKAFLSKFKNVERLNASKNRISSLPYDTFMNTPKLWKINLSENFIETFHKDTFIFTQALQVLDVSNNPLAFCGLGIGHLRTLESKLRILDLRATNFPAKLEGHWNALMLYYDVGEAPRIIHQEGDLKRFRKAKRKKD